LTSTAGFNWTANYLFLAQGVRAILLDPLNDEWDEAEWLPAAARNPAFAFLSDPEGDIYSLADGKPFHDEV
jgi:hypothetical protein